MALKNIKANDSLIEEIRRFTTSGGVHHAYIIEGPASARKMELAKSFAQALLCEEEPGEGCGRCRICRNIDQENYADVMFLRPTKAATSNSTSIKVGEVEDMIATIQKKPAEGQRLICIIEDFDLMTIGAMNVLLKTLEEPPEGTVIMMLSENTAMLPQTIVSRSVVLRMMSYEDSEDPYHMKAEKFIEAMTGRDGQLAVKKIVEDLGKDRSEVILFLDSLEDAYRERLVGRTNDIKKDDVFRAVEEIERARQKVSKSAVVAYALKSMALRIGGPV